nr:discoidin domain-containing protein [Pedobacter panaciterrae]
MNTKIKYNILILLGLGIFLGCKKNDAFNEETDSKKGAQVFLAKANRGLQELQIFPFTDDARSINFGVEFGAVGLPASPIRIKVAIDNRAFDSLNVIRSTSALPLYEKFPADAYSIDRTDLTIPKGGVSSELVNVKYFSKKFDTEKDYLLPISITDASGYDINPNVKTILIVVPKLVEKVASRSKWKVTASSEELTGEGAVNGHIAAVIDGDINTFWHSSWSTVEPPFPHWLEFNMVDSTYITKIALTPRQNNSNGFTKFKLEASLDGATWTVIGDNLVFNPSLKQAQEYPVEHNWYKYLKLTMLEGKQKSTHLAEFTAYTY